MHAHSDIYDRSRVLRHIFPSSLVDSFDASTRHTMAASSESKPEQTELSTQDLPTIPTAEEMEIWDEEKVLRWIQQRNRNILKGNNLENFKKECIMGTAFLASDVEFYQTYGLPRGVGLALKNLADQVKEGKFIPWT